MRSKEKVKKIQLAGVKNVLYKIENDKFHFISTNIFSSSNKIEELKLFEMKYNDTKLESLFEDVSKQKTPIRSFLYEDIKGEKGVNIKLAQNEHILNNVYKKQNEYNKNLLIKYFKTEYQQIPENNVLIQIIHLLLDIKRILVKYISEIMTKNLSEKIYVDKLSGVKTFELYSIEKFNSNKEIFKKLVSNIPLFEDCFNKNLEITEDIKKEKVYNFAIFISRIRQWIVHNQKLNIGTDLFVKNFLKEKSAFLKEFYNSNYGNIKFLKERELVESDEEFYNYMIYDSFNIGISIKKIRKYIVSNSEEMKKIEYDLYKKNINYALDFYLLNHFKNEEKKQETIKKLKQKTDEEKEIYYKELSKEFSAYLFEILKYFDGINISSKKIYELFSKDINLKNERKENNLKNSIKRKIIVFGCDKVEKVFVDFLNKNKDSNFNDDKSKIKIYEELMSELNKIEKDNISTEDISFKVENVLPKIIFGLSLVLNKKDRNILFSQVINKIESIIYLLNITSEKFLNISFSQIDFEDIIIVSREKINEIEEIKKELIFCKNIVSKSQKKQSDLFIKKNFEDFLSIINKTFNKNIIKGSDEEKEKKKYFNFFKNNIYKNKKYRYIVEYSLINEITKILKNDIFVYITLKYMNLIDSKYLKTYLKRIENSEKYDNEAYLITDDDYIKIINELKKIHLNLDQNSKEDKKNNSRTFPLYFDVAYFFLKKMININSYYVIAFSDYIEKYSYINKTNINNEKIIDELDLSLFKDKIQDISDKKAKKQVLTIGEKQIMKLSDKFKGILSDKNKEKKAENIFKSFRNSLAHFEFLKNIRPNSIVLKNFTDEYNKKINNKKIKEEKVIESYFYKFYHNLIQNDLFFKKNAELNFLNFTKNNNYLYSRELVIFYCLPFAYNISRYNNLVVSKFFIK